MTTLARASHYFDADYRLIPGDLIEIRAHLGMASGEVLASHAVEIPASLVDPDLLKAPQREDPAFMADLTALESRISPASFHIELFTRKGRNNLLRIPQAPHIVHS